MKPRVIRIEIKPDKIQNEDLYRIYDDNQIADKGRTKDGIFSWFKRKL